MHRRWRERDDRHDQDLRPNRREIPMAMTDDGSLQVMLLGLEADRSIVPVVSFGDGRRVKNVQQHAAWMLQTFLGASSKADSLYDIVKERKLQNEAEGLGVKISSDGVQVGQLKDSNYPPYQAIGVSGKHSVMFALVVRMVMAEGHLPKGFWEDLEPYGLSTVLQDIITQLQDVVLRLVSAEAMHDRITVDCNYIPPSLQRGKAASEWREKRTTMCTELSRGDPVSPPLCEGIQLWIINGNVPVINLPQSSSIFCEHVSWMLQAAMGSEGKAKDLMEYIEDFNEVSKIRRTYDECRSRIGLSDQDIALVRLGGLGNEVLAVGSAGKRSCMLAAVVAIALQDDNHLKDLDPQMRRMYPELLKPFRNLIRSAVEAERQGQRGRSHGDNKTRRGSRSRDRRR